MALKRKVNSINITKQIEKLKGLLMFFRENDQYGVNWKLVEESVDNLTTTEVIENKIDEIIYRAEQRVRKK